jgi:uncharacterized protein
MDDIRVLVCYARAETQFLRELVLPAGAVLETAVRESGVLADAADIDLNTCRVGIYGKLKALDTPLRDGDRVELYRPLVADPKEARRKRAKKS